MTTIGDVADEIQEARRKVYREMEKLKCPCCGHDIDEHGGTGCAHSDGVNQWCRCKYSACAINLAWLKKEYVEIKRKLDIAVEALNKLNDWTKAYPKDIYMFAEPDWEEVKDLLGSKVLTQISASNMRHVVDGMKDIVIQALKQLEK